MHPAHWQIIRFFQRIRLQWPKIGCLLTIALAVACFSQYIWHNEVRKTLIRYWAEDLVTAHGKMNLMIGSSTIARLQSETHIGCGNWLNRGIGNSKLATLKMYLQYSSLSIDPAILLLYAGENDLAAGSSVACVVREYKDLIDQLRYAYPEAHIHIFAIKPSPRRRRYWSRFAETNNAIEKSAVAMPGVFFHRPDWQERTGVGAPLFKDDGVHLTDKGYQVLTGSIRPLCSNK